MTEQTLTPNAGRLTRLLPVLLAAVTLAVFLPVCRFGFVDWDDPLHTYQNPFLEPPTFAHLARFWRGIYQGEYIPVCYMAFALLSVFGRFPHPVQTPGGGLSVLNPHVFHTANLLLHTVNVLLVFGLLRRIVRHDGGAFAGALLFALHPVQVEAVAWISELRGLLAGCLGLGALHLYLGYAEAATAGTARVRRRYCGALVLFALALLVKPSAAALPAVAWVLDRGVARRPLRRTLAPLLGWIVALLPVAGLTHSAQPVPAFLHLPLWQRPLIAADALAFYLSKLLLPLRLAADYGRTPAHVLHSGAALWAGPATVLLLALLAWHRRHTQPWLFVACGLFAAALLPVLGFVPFIFQNFSTVADRYLYLAMLGPALLVAAALARDSRLAPCVAVSLFLALCVCLSRAQVGVWHDSGTLFEHAVAVNPRSPQMRYNFGNFYSMHGRPAEAIAQYRAAIRLRLDYPQAHSNLGAALAESGQSAEAVVQLREALRQKPDFPAAHLSLGIQFLNNGDLPGACREWRETIRLAPDNVMARYNLGCALFRQKRPAEAANQFRAVLRLEPDNAAALQALRLLGREASSPSAASRLSLP